jgi:hypothetical protein
VLDHPATPARNRPPVTSTHALLDGESGSIQQTEASLEWLAEQNGFPVRQGGGHEAVSGTHTATGLANTYHPSQVDWFYGVEHQE